MGHRGRHRRRSRLALAVAPSVLAAVLAASVTASAAQSGHRLEPTSGTAIEHPTPAPPGWLHAAAALAADAPFSTRAVKVSKHHPGASAPIVHLPTALDMSAASIPRRVLASYVNAAEIVDAVRPGCQLAWQTLAGIGLIESDHARSGGSADPHWNGIANPPIYGPALDGAGKFAKIANTDPSEDRAGEWARAVGPMQFIPSTWASWAADGNGDGTKNPQDIDDATLAAADYLCAAAQEQNQPKHLVRAVYAYNHSYRYVRAVLIAAAGYENIDPNELGVDGLPGASKHKSKHHRHQHRAAVNPTATARASRQPSPRPSPVWATPSAPTWTSAPVPTPTPTESGTPADPEPSPTESDPSPTPTDSSPD